jgi:hypothetical protein
MPRKHRSAPKPCERCGGEKLPGQGQRYCADCHELAQWATARKRKTRVVKSRQPCVDCGGIKEPGHGRRVCLRCAKRRRGQRRCLHCRVAIEVPRRLCPSCKAEALAKRRRFDNERNKRYRATHPKPKRKPLTKAQNEDRHFNYRQREGENGGRRTLSQAEYVKRYGTGTSKTAVVPVGPLVAPLAAYMAEVPETAAAEIANTSPRRIAQILKGEGVVSVITADKLCVLLGLPFSLLYGEI